MLSEYNFKFYLNARHFMVMDGQKGKAHSHTWEIEVRIATDKDDFFKFSEIEKNIDNYINNYDSKVLNDCAPFDSINPSLENIGKVMFEKISEILHKGLWTLKHLAISENPTRTYIVKNTEFYGIVAAPIPANNEEEIKKALRRIDEMKSQLVGEATQAVLSNQDLKVQIACSLARSEGFKKQIAKDVTTSVIQNKALKNEITRNVTKDVVDQLSVEASQEITREISKYERVIKDKVHEEYCQLDKRNPKSAYPRNLIAAGSAIALIGTVLVGALNKRRA